MKSNNNFATFTSEDLITVSRWFLHNMMASIENAPTSAEIYSSEVSQ